MSSTRPMARNPAITRRSPGLGLRRSLPRSLALLAAWSLSVVLPAALVVGGWALAAPSAQAADEKAPAYRVNDVTQVFVGNPRLFKKPCVVSTDRVYRAIPEYKEILEKNLTDKDVRYHFLMRKASDKFSRAVQALARDLSYDLVAGTGAVTATSAESPAIPDGTDGAISRLPS